MDEPKWLTRPKARKSQIGHPGAARTSGTRCETEGAGRPHPRFRSAHGQVAALGRTSRQPTGSASADRDSVLSALAPGEVAAGTWDGNSVPSKIDHAIAGALGMDKPTLDWVESQEFPTRALIWNSTTQKSQPHKTSIPGETDRASHRRTSLPTLRPGRRRVVTRRKCIQ